MHQQAALLRFVTTPRNVVLISLQTSTMRSLQNQLSQIDYDVGCRVHCEPQKQSYCSLLAGSINYSYLLLTDLQNFFSGTLNRKSVL